MQLCLQVLMEGIESLRCLQYILEIISCTLLLYGVFFCGWLLLEIWTTKSFLLDLNDRGFSPLNKRYCAKSIGDAEML